MTDTQLTSAEHRIFEALKAKINQICSRDEIAQALWAGRWLEKYSDWEIDTQIYRLRRKIASEWGIRTLRNRGYFLYPIPPASPVQDSHLDVLALPNVVKPPLSYLTYMNNPQAIRRTLSDLLTAIDQANLLPDKNSLKNILVIDSYTWENIDTISAWAPAAQIYFSHFDDRALEAKRHRLGERHLKNITCLYDDIRSSRFKSAIFDLVINDFRLNFNLTHAQNQAATEHMHRILRPGGFALISVVVDPRYESARYGQDQAKAPLNLKSPGTFIGDEQLERRCFTVPYYNHLFTTAGFTILSEFDIKNGQTWAKTLKTFNHATGPFYRRFLLQ
jgi:SAM-dependent methyltransferase